MNTRTLIPLRQVATLTALSHNTLYRLLKNGQIPGARKISGAWFFDQATLHTFLRGNDPTAPASSSPSSTTDAEHTPSTRSDDDDDNDDDDAEAEDDDNDDDDEVDADDDADNDSDGPDETDQLRALQEQNAELLRRVQTREAEIRELRKKAKWGTVAKLVGGILAIGGAGAVAVHVVSKPPKKPPEK